MNSSSKAMLVGLLFGASPLMGCSSESQKAVTPTSTGGTAAQIPGVGDSGIALVAVPNDQDPPPVAKPTGLAPTPPMGWNSWNSYSVNVTAELIKNVADLMVSNGMTAAGYEYINIDDGWTLRSRVAPGSLDAAASDAGDSVLVPDPTRFPSEGALTGIEAVANYVHAKGLKLGIYSDRGSATCGNYAASGGHELTDARTFAAWGVDYLKYDNCNAIADTMQHDYAVMRDALDTAIRESGHDIVFSLCSWAFNEWNLETGQLWRTTGDIGPSFSSATSISSYANTILRIVSLNRAFAAYSGPNSWNDADMLEVGNLGNSEMANTESRTHFNLWAMMASPLIAGNKLDTMSSETLKTLTNTKVIAVDQDYLGLQGVAVAQTNSTMVFAKPLNKAGARAVLLVNSALTTQNVSVNLTDIGLSAGAASAVDLWSDTGESQPVQDRYSVDIPAHGSVMLEIDGNEPGIPQGTVYLSDVQWTYAANAYGTPSRDTNNDSDKGLSLGGTAYPKGLGVTAGSKIIYRLAKRCSNFSAIVGLDDASKSRGSVVLQVFADGEMLFDSGKMTGSDAPQSVNVDVSGKYKLTLFVSGGGDLSSWDLADWADAKITCSP